MLDIYRITVPGLITDTETNPCVSEPRLSCSSAALLAEQGLSRLWRRPSGAWIRHTALRGKRGREEGVPTFQNF